VDFDKIVYRDDDIEDDLDSKLFNSVASTISKWRTFKLLRRVQLLNRLMELNEFCIVIMALKVTSIITKLLSLPLITFEPLSKFA
jgi:hypothetical protein